MGFDALVTDAHERSAVWGLRGLGRAGLRLAAQGPNRLAAGLWSRYVSERIVAPDVVDDPEAFAIAVGGLGSRLGPFVAYASQEESIDALLAARERLPPEVVIPYPETRAVQTVRNKLLLPELAAGAGLATPVRLLEGTAAEVARSETQTPCVVKALNKGTALGRAHVIQHADDLVALLTALPPDERMVVERSSSGPLGSISLVIDREGAIAARFQQRALSTWPPDAGPSRLAVSVPLDEVLVGRVARMLAEAGYWGLAQVQFIETADGPELIDVNPRFYGSMALALASGVNLPEIWHSVVVGTPLPGPNRYRIGVTYRWLEAELLAALHGSPHLILQRAPRPRVGAMWAGEDPRPGALLGVRAAAGWSARQASRLRRTPQELPARACDGAPD